MVLAFIILHLALIIILYSQHALLSHTCPIITHMPYYQTHSLFVFKDALVYRV